MGRSILLDDQWERIKDHLLGKATDRGVTAGDNHRFLEVVLWISRTGSPWRDLPKELGHWHRVYVRYNRWSKKGDWARIFEVLSTDKDLEKIWGLSKESERKGQVLFRDFAQHLLD